MQPIKTKPLGSSVWLNFKNRTESHSHKTQAIITSYNHSIPSLQEQQMAAVRMMAAAAAATATSTTATATTSCFLLKKPLRLNQKPHSNSLFLFNGKRQVSSFSSTSSVRRLTCNAIYNPEVQIRGEGQPETLDYRVFFLDNSGKKVSPWHDVPLHLGDGVFNFIVEIPKESSAKMEVATDEQFTPIKQDTKKGKLRYYP